MLCAMSATTLVIREVMAWAAERLDQDLSVGVLSQRAGYSTHHFSRAFAAIAGESPARWVRGLRVAHACERLVDSRARILDIALECGFNDVTTFARAFRRSTGLSPSHFRRVRRNEEVPHENVAIAERVFLPAFRLCGLSADIDEDATAPAALWQRLMSLIEETGLEIAYDAFRQIAFWRHNPNGRCTCVAGFVQEGDEQLPLPFVTVDIPAATCRRFVINGRSDCYQAAYDAVFDTLLPAMRDRPLGNYVCERPRLDGGEGIEIWVPVAGKPA